MREAKLRGLEISAPDILVSDLSWKIDGKRIVAGFTQIKGIGDKTAERIIEWRNAGEEEFGMDDFFWLPDRYPVRPR